MNSVCPGCGLELASDLEGLDKHFNASLACVDLYWQLSAFTLTIGDSNFIHQHVVDTYAAQHVGPNMKPITATFALVGLYLTVEHCFTGRQVQLAHIALAKKHVAWPHFEAPAQDEALAVQDVLSHISTDDYRKPIMDWASSVWRLWHAEHEHIRLLIEQVGLEIG